MKKLMTTLALIAIISGCASTKPVDMSLIMTEAIIIAQDVNLNFINIPSHGAIADATSIAVNGGGAADQLRLAIEQLNNAGGGNLVVTSTNPELPLAHITGAMGGLEVEIKNLLLIYAGNKEYSDLIQLQVEAKGIKYGFVDTYK